MPNSTPKASETQARDAITASWTESFNATTEAVHAVAAAIRAARAPAAKSSYSKREPKSPDHAQRVWQHACTAVLEAERKRDDADPMVVAALEAIVNMRVDPRGV